MTKIDLEFVVKKNPNIIKEELSRRSFLYYIQYINPSFKVGWWNRGICEELQQFYEDLMSGARPVLIVEAPPQHGKSVIVTYFLSWLAGKQPTLKKIYASYSERLGVRANMLLQRIFDTEKYQKIFPKTEINTPGAMKKKGQFSRTSEFLEYIGTCGYFRNTTVRGSITGESLDVGVVDDPIKSREEANSETIREKTWDWFTDDFFSRFSDFAGLIIIMTRWHVDDPTGRLLNFIEEDEDQSFGKVTVYSYPAIAEEDEEHRKKGEALFPDLKSLSFLLTRKKLMTASSWASLYQQRPYIKGGGLFDVESFKLVHHVPELKGNPVRYWDKAGTEDGGAYTAGVKICETVDGQWVVLDVVRKQMSPLKREKRIRMTAELDGTKTRVWIEQEPGSAGKESAENTIRKLKGFIVKADKVTGSKEERAEPYAAQVEGGNILILKADWNKDFIDEHETFPNGNYLDQVDAAAGAFNKLAHKLLLGFTDEEKSSIKEKAQKRKTKKQADQW